MSLTIAEELRRIFDLATLRSESAELRTGRQWKAVSELSARCDHARDKERKLFASRYQTRVETARRRLIDEAAAKSFDLKPAWANDDPFSPEATLRQARREVQARHDSRLQRIDDFERQSLRILTLCSTPEKGERTCNTSMIPMNKTG